MDEKQLRALAGEMIRQLDTQRRGLALYRDYYDGRFRVPYLPPSATEEFLKIMDRAKANWCRKVIDITARRLSVVGVRSNQTPVGDLWDIWQRSKMDKRQGMTHRSAMRFGVAYVSVGEGRLRQDGSIAGSDISITPLSPMGVTHISDPSDPDVVLYAMRRWQDRSKRSFAYLWTPDEWILFSGAVGSRNSITTRGVHSLGRVPVVPFKNVPDEDGNYTSDLEIALPIQDRINQTIADRLMGQTYGAHRQRALIGYPIEMDEDDQPKPPPFKPSVDRTWIIEDENVKAHEFSETNIMPFIAACEADIKHLASLTDTPPQDLLGEMVNISAEALKAAQSANTAKVKDRARTFGEDWEAVLNLAGDLSGIPADDALEVVWEDNEPRSESELMDALTKKRSLGVPLATIWAEMGYSPEMITTMQDEFARESAAAAAAQAAAFGVDVPTA